MQTLLKIAWRNVWRNKARSIVIILAIGFGLWGGIASTALMNGMLQQMFNSSIENQVSHIQVHNPEYTKEKRTEFVVHDADNLLAALDTNRRVVAFSARTLSSGMLATASMNSGVELFGVDPVHEDQTTHLSEHLIEGDYFESVSRNPVLIGAALADKMKLELRNRLVLTFQDMNGEIVSASFRVCGIYRTSNTRNDERIVYLKQTDMEDLIGGEDVVNEIAILLDDIEEVHGVKEALQSQFPDNQIRMWAEVAPELSFMREFSGISMMVLLIIILMALAFGLLNTMLMTIFERTRELGVLMSVGMSKARVFSMILLETAFLVVTGSAFGSLIGAVTVFITKKTGVDLTSMGADTFSDYGIDAVVYPALDDMFYVHLAILVLLTAISAAVYPAYKALSLNPAEAVRTE